MEEIKQEPREFLDRKARLAEIASLRGEAALRAFIRFVLDLDALTEDETEEWRGAISQAVG